MFRILQRTATRVAVCAMLGMTVLGAASAQPPDGPPPPPPGGPMAMIKPITPVDLPLPVLTKALGLTADQKSQVGQIQKDFRDAAHELMPPPPMPGTPPPDPADLHATMEKLHALEQEANKKIEGALSAAQKQTLSLLLRDANDFRAVGIPAEVVPQLKLADTQKTKLATIAKKARQAMHAALEQGRQDSDPRAIHETLMKIHREAHDSAMAVLTDDQRAIIEAFVKDHPPHGPGGPGGPH